ncbi:hypothetical protein [Streptomyces sp. NPDC003077]|uniref:hypothetical protein n=1 Tax=Streptomyces sp. NPDC003077 TaxID=3154443 RepID=UPI0033B40958
MPGLQRTLEERAQGAGLGGVRRVHRQWRSWNARLAGLVGVATVVGAGWLYSSGHWVLCLLVPLLVVVAGLAWAYWAPIATPDGRWRFVVCENGLLLWSERNGELAVIPWDAVEGIEPVGFGGSGRLESRLLFTADDGVPSEVYVPTVGARGDLFSAVRARGPQPVRVVRRVVVSGVVVAVVALSAWVVVVPQVVTATVDGRPDELGGFARACEGAGARFSGAAYYRVDGPRPLVLFDVEENGEVKYDMTSFSTSGAARTSAQEKDAPAPDPGAVQLVACRHPVGRMSESPFKTCTYTGGVTLAYYQGRYRVDVYESRTHRKVGSVEVAGDDSPECPKMARIAKGDERERTTEPTSYETALAPFVTGPRM